MSVDVATGALDELHEELRAVTRRIVGRPPAALGDASPPALPWADLASAGLLGLEVPDALGGAGATFAEVAVVLHELGRSPATGPYLGSAVLGVGALSLVDQGPRRDELLAALAAGEATVAVALTGTGGPTRAGGPDGTLETAAGTAAGTAAATAPPFLLAERDGRPVLHGGADLVPDAPGADRLLLLAATDGGEVVLVDLAPGAPALAVEEHAVVDATRRLGTVVAEDVPLDPTSIWRFAGDPDAAVALLRDRAATAVACDSLGLAEAMLEATVAYAKVRQQFGRPIGSFQAVQHACADMLVEVSVCRELVDDAVRAVASRPLGSADGAGVGATADAAAGAAAGTDDRSLGELVAHRGVAASMAKSHVCAAAVDIAGKAMQLHGGIGYTWESGVHAYLKRATLDRSLFGSPADHRRQVGARYLEAAWWSGDR